MKSERKLGAEQGLDLGLAYVASCPFHLGRSAFPCAVNTNLIAYRNEIFPELT